MRQVVKLNLWPSTIINQKTIIAHRPIEDIRFKDKECPCEGGSGAWRSKPRMLEISKEHQSLSEEAVDCFIWLHASSFQLSSDH